jgi:hypothetical protein
VFRASHVLHVCRTHFIRTLILSFAALIAISPAVFSASDESNEEMHYSGMHVFRLGNSLPHKTSRENRMKSIKSFTTTGFVAGICKTASSERNMVDFMVGEQIFSKTINLFISNNDKEITLTSTTDPRNAIIVTHNLYGNIRPIKLVDALRAYFGHLKFLKESADERIYSYVGDTVYSASTDLSSIIPPEAISAVPGTISNIYGICVSRDLLTNNVHYTLTDGITQWVRSVDPQPHVTAADDVKRSIDFGNGISLVASIYGENEYLSVERALEYELIQVLKQS